MAPDVAIVGEVRDREAMPLLLTLSSGVQGFTTIHAGSARQALSRLRFICQLAETGSELSVAALSALVSEAVDLVVHCFAAGDGAAGDRGAGGRGPPGSGRHCGIHDHVSSSPGPDSHDPLAWTGILPVRAVRALELQGFDIRSLTGGDLVR